MAIVLFDTANSKDLYPLTCNKAAAALRCGIYTIKERWQKIAGKKVYIFTAGYLSGLYNDIPFDEHIWIDALIFTDDKLLQKILLLNEGEYISNGEGFIAGRGKIDAKNFISSNPKQYFNKEIKYSEIKKLQHLWQIFQWNDEMIRNDFTLITKEKSSQQISSSNKIIGEENIFIEPGAAVEHAIINASAGPVYIGKNVLIMEGAMLRGPLALCEGSVIKMGAKIYGATTIGEYCVAGGEIKNSIINNYSNKAHDGYLGDSIIGEWCNLGAGTANSNVKNTGADVKVWNDANKILEDAGNKCGMVMGDYTFTAINTSINTGTVIGICCNVFGEGLTPKHIPGFSWGFHNFKQYNFTKLLQHIDNWKKMKGHSLTKSEQEILKHIFEKVTAEENFEDA